MVELPWMWKINSILMATTLFILCFNLSIVCKTRIQRTSRSSLSKSRYEFRLFIPFTVDKPSSQCSQQRTQAAKPFRLSSVFVSMEEHSHFGSFFDSTRARYIQQSSFSVSCSNSVFFSCLDFAVFDLSSLHFAPKLRKRSPVRRYSIERSTLCSLRVRKADSTL